MAGNILLLRVCNIKLAKKSLFKRRRFNQHLRLNKVVVLELMLIRNASNSTHSVLQDNPADPVVLLRRSCLSSLEPLPVDRGRDISR